MARPYKTLDEVEKKLLQNPKYKEEYDKMKPFMDIAIEIVKIRSSMGLSQSQLASKVGTTQTVISKIENLEANDIKLSTLYKIAVALNLTLDIKFIPAA